MGAPSKNAYTYVKYRLFSVFLFLGYSLVAQTVSIVATDNQAAEVAVGFPDNAIFTVSKSTISGTPPITVN